MATTQNATRKYTAEDWEEQRAEISRLYENLTLESVIQIMAERRGLEATPKQYKDRIRKWGLNKHIQKDEMEWMIRTRRQRKTTMNKATAFILRGRPVTEDKIDRYEREHPAQSVADADVNMDLVTPPDISCHTPRESESLIPEESKIPQTTGKPGPEVISQSSIPSSAQPSAYPSSSSSGYGYHGSYQQAPPQVYSGFTGLAPPIPQHIQSQPVQNALHRPPDGLQSFGGAGTGAPAGYTFQYSNCTGRRKALLIGINYLGQRGQLRGCINDVKNMSSFLNENFGYKRDDMVLLTDDQQKPMSQPTKQNILRAMHWLVKDARPNDSLFFHYSGHGGQTKDLDGDEDEGYDEVIYPVDFRQVGHIIDDEMHRIMVSPLAAGVRLTAIFDSCHSGTALDLPYIYSTQGILKEPNLAKEAGQGLLATISSYATGDHDGVAKNLMGFLKNKATSRDDAKNSKMATKTSPADVVMWSGSSDYQKLADPAIASQATGAMSWAFITAMKQNPDQSYVQLLNSIRDTLATKYTQKPQLSCSHPLNTNLLYVM